MNTTRRNLAVAATLLALGGSLVGATSAMAADPSTPPHAHHTAAQAPEPTAEVATAGPDRSVGLGTPAYLDQLKTDQDVDTAQRQLVEFMKSRGLQAQLALDEDGRPFADYDPFVEANLDAEQDFWDARSAQG